MEKIEWSLTKRDSISSGLSINPESNPGHSNEKDARKVHLEHEVASVSLKIEVRLEHATLSFRRALTNQHSLSIFLRHNVMEYYDIVT